MRLALLILFPLSFFLAAIASSAQSVSEERVVVQKFADLVTASFWFGLAADNVALRGDTSFVPAGLLSEASQSGIAASGLKVDTTFMRDGVKMVIYSFKAMLTINTVKEWRVAVDDQLNLYRLSGFANNEIKTAALRLYGEIDPATAVEAAYFILRCSNPYTYAALIQSLEVSASIPGTLNSEVQRCGLTCDIRLFTLSRKGELNVSNVSLWGDFDHDIVTVPLQ